MLPPAELYTFHGYQIMPVWGSGVGTSSGAKVRVSRGSYQRRGSAIDFSVSNNSNSPREM